MTNKIVKLNELLKIKPEEVEEKLKNFIKDHVLKFKRKGIVIGISGGIDSALSATLAVRTLGKEKVFAVLLPEEESDSRSTEFGKELCKQLDISYKIISLTPTLQKIGVYDEKNKLIKELFPEYAPNKHKTSLRFPSNLLTETSITFPIIKLYEANKEVGSKRLNVSQYNKIISLQNVKQRLRMIHLYKEAEERNFLVLGTTNKTELILGQFVKFGDGGVDVEPLADLYKTQVYELSKYLKIPQSIIDRPPSPDTWSQFTSDEDFYWRMPLEYLDKLLIAKEQGIAVEIIAEELKLEVMKVKQCFDHFNSVIRSTAHLYELTPMAKL